MATSAALKARLAKRNASLAILEATYDELISSGVLSYRFDSTEGEQQTKRRELSEVKKQMDNLVAEIESIERKLSGSGLVMLGLRRR